MKVNTMEKTVFESAKTRKRIHYLNVCVTLVAIVPIVLNFVHLERIPKFTREKPVPSWWPKELKLPHEETIHVIAGVFTCAFALYEYLSFKKNEKVRRMKKDVKWQCATQAVRSEEQSQAEAAKVIQHSFRARPSSQAPPPPAPLRTPRPLQAVQGRVKNSLQVVQNIT